MSFGHKLRNTSCSLSCNTLSGNTGAVAVKPSYFSQMYSISTLFDNYLISNSPLCLAHKYLKGLMSFILHYYYLNLLIYFLKSISLGFLPHLSSFSLTACSLKLFYHFIFLQDLCLNKLGWKNLLNHLLKAFNFHLSHSILL